MIELEKRYAEEQVRRLTAARKVKSGATTQESAFQRARARRRRGCGGGGRKAAAPPLGAKGSPRFL